FFFFFFLLLFLLIALTVMVVPVPRRRSACSQHVVFAWPLRLLLATAPFVSAPLRGHLERCVGLRGCKWRFWPRRSTTQQRRREQGMTGRQMERQTQSVQ
ncbi:hypothetical protein BKA80DRAFT_268818, partial [Phyllosticta citrichinensis]